MKPFTVTRPWGSFRRFDPGEPVTVKILRLNPNQILSLQFHHNRSEFWHIISGKPNITIGDKTVTAKMGDEFMIEKGVHHRIGAGEEEVIWMEFWFGSMDEDDIVRLQDNYGRA